ncbi:hypothetical protein SLG_08820 [Sphingobium sp. SYK-6]|uniref:hypothetical protein n=1 Tax=Sphingobium sp. (strain NBRC 103272 / SYK-6) TaxID=627192 RepID=UPI0002276C73|nr:hypothetical protein [Sphingobium sp. SYK-6]BAK65557.1 hypothetical protein SLG_08820 [Sphingobium sp. SYK-6]
MLAHIPLVLFVQFAAWLFGKVVGIPEAAALWLGCFAACAVCIVREVTQREYQWIEASDEGKRRNMPVLVGLKVWEWNRHARYETAVACTVAFLVALLVTAAH